MAVDPRNLAAGDRLGRYLVRERLGEGAAATVYRADDLERARAVALKVLHATSEDGLSVSRLEREVELVSRLDHPGVGRVHELGRDGDAVYLVMEYVLGRTLESVLATETRLAPARAGRMMRDIAAAVGHAHAAGILHRDLKPRNIMVRADDRPVVLDFGLATGPGVSQLTRVGAWIGTFHYAAPETLRGVRPVPASDVFALGVCLYRMLTGDLPVRGEHVGMVAEAALRHGPPPPSSVVAEVPAVLDEVVARALRPNPADRFADAHELCRALADIVTAAGEPSAVTRTRVVAPRPRGGAPLEDTDPAATPRDSEPTAIFASPPAGLYAPGSTAAVTAAAPSTADLPDAAPEDVVALDVTPAPVPTHAPPRYVPPAGGGLAPPKVAGADTRAGARLGKPPGAKR
jgi:serine/threonine-protein kinase